MSTKMIRLADAQAAIRYAIDYYERTIREILRKAADSDLDEELLIAAEAAVDGAKRAQLTLATVRVYEAEDFAAVRIVDKKWIPEEMHSAAEEQAIKSVLRCVGETLDSAGMLKARMSTGITPEQTKITITFTAVKPCDSRWEMPEVSDG